MRFTPYNHPLNWLTFSTNGSLEILESYVEGVENQVKVSIQQFELNAKKHFFDPEHPDEPGYVLTTHMGLDDASWDLGSIFKEHFPSLQRQGALICLYSALENELNRLCVLLQKHEKVKVAFKHINGNGIVRARTYLKNVMELDLSTASASWEEIRSIGLIRNKFVHSDGKIEGFINEQKYVKSCKFLNTNDQSEVLLEEGFLKHFIDTKYKFYQHVQLALDKKYKK